jgi:glycosyltransferase involved in cell wall biosynthesis
MRKGIDVVMLYINSGGLTLPIMLSKILNKKVVLIVSASDSGMASIIYKDYLFGVGGRIVVAIYKALEKINWVFADRIMVDSEKIARDYAPDSYRHKAIIANDRRFIDADTFRVKKKLEERRNLVGYIGRLSYEKGVMNLVRAIPLVLKQRADLEFLIGGDGPLLIKLREEIAKAGLDNKVNFTGWIPHGELADWLNELKLLVLPSYTEGLPNIVLEAMACGTPVLVTPVGALPDIIKDKETGFIIEDNTPNRIAENIITTLQYPKLDEIVTKARQFVTEKYTYETAVGRYKAILSQLAGKV